MLCGRNIGCPLASAPLTGLGFERQAAWLLDAVSGQFWWRKASRFRFHTGGSDGELLCKGEGGTARVFCSQRVLFD